MSDVPSLTMKQLQQLCEASYLQRGMEYYDDKKVLQASRFGGRLFGNVAGSGSPYRVTVDFADKIKARCTCPAARRTTFCKHAVALLVSWAKAPESFVAATEDPGLQTDPGKKKKASVRKGKQDTNTLIDAGLKSLNQFLADIGTTGLAAVTESRLQQIYDLAENLRTYRLRRLSTALLHFGELLHDSRKARGDLDLRAYASNVADMVFTARAVSAINEGKLKDDRYMEELVGKTWTVKNLPEVSGLSLCEVAYEQYETVDNFHIESSVFVDVPTGELYSEKLIVPAFMRAQAGSKPSRTGCIVQVEAGRRYPGFPPIRMKIERFEQRPLEAPDLAVLLGHAAADFEAVRQKWLAFRQDLFAPDDFFVLTRVRGFVAGRQALAALDDSGRLLPLGAGRGAPKRVDEALALGEPLALFGKLLVGASGLAIEPWSVVLKVREDLVLRPLEAAET